MRHWRQASAMHTARKVYPWLHWLHLKHSIFTRQAGIPTSTDEYRRAERSVDPVIIVGALHCSTLFTSNQKWDVRVAVVDSVAWASIVRKKILDTTMRKLGIFCLKKAQKSQGKHQFGTSSMAYKTIAAVSVSFTIVMPNYNDHVEFHIRFDIAGSSFFVSYWLAIATIDESIVKLLLLYNALCNQQNHVSPWSCQG